MVLPVQSKSDIVALINSWVTKTGYADTTDSFLFTAIILLQMLKDARNDPGWREHFRLTHDQFYGE